MLKRLTVLVLLGLAVPASADARLSTTTGKYVGEAKVAGAFLSRDWTESWYFSGCGRRSPNALKCYGGISGTVEVTYQSNYCTPGAGYSASLCMACQTPYGPPCTTTGSYSAAKLCNVEVRVVQRSFKIRTRTRIENCKLI